MRVTHKTEILELTPEEYEKRMRLVDNYINNQCLDEKWISARENLKLKFTFDSNFNRYYVTLKFDKATF